MKLPVQSSDFVKSKLTIKFPKLDLTSLRIIGFSDASFAGNRDFSIQLGYIIFIGDNTDRVIPVFSKSYKARHVTRFVIGAELIAFSDIFTMQRILSLLN